MMTVTSATDGVGMPFACSDEFAEGFGCQPVAVDASFDELGVAASFAGGDGGVDVPVDGAEDFVGEFGVEGEAAFGHAGGGVEAA